MPKQNQALITQILIAAIFGIVFVCILLVIAYVTPNPTSFQEWIYRVVMSLAAGGIGAIIPGLLTFNSPWVKAGGAMACFAIVYLMNPPSLASQKLRSQSYFDLMDRANTALARANLPLAKRLYSTAIELNPDAYVPYQKLADAEFDGAEFKNAELHYKRAYDLSNKSDAAILYNAALCEEALKDYELAVQTFETIANNVQRDKSYAQDISFSIAQLKLKIWQRKTSDSNTYKQAVDGFKAFLEAGEEPSYWAHYHLACLYATKGTLAEISNDRISQLKDDAINELGIAIDKMTVSVAKKAGTHRQMLRDLLNKDVQNPLPGNPVPCPALRELAQQKLSRDKLQIVQNM
jgi:tetratricopeptide (TPR) repeat protein